MGDGDDNDDDEDEEGNDYVKGVLGDYSPWEWVNRSSVPRS